MKLRVEFKQGVARSGVVVRITCIDAGDYPTKKIFYVDYYDNPVGLSVKGHASREAEEVHISEVFETNAEAINYAEKIERLVCSQYRLYCIGGSVSLPNDYTIDLSKPLRQTMEEKF